MITLRALELNFILQHFMLELVYVSVHEELNSYVFLLNYSKLYYRFYMAEAAVCESLISMGADGTGDWGDMTLPDS